MSYTRPKAITGLEQRNNFVHEGFITLINRKNTSSYFYDYLSTAAKSVWAFRKE
jgi:hypothetical protein